jgi:hypothetical protein
MQCLLQASTDAVAPEGRVLHCALQALFTYVASSVKEIWVSSRVMVPARVRICTTVPHL